MKNIKLRIAWIIPNLICYFMLIGLTIFVVVNRDGLYELKELSIYAIFILVLFIVSVFGSYQIWNWIKDGKV